MQYLRIYDKNVGKIETGNWGLPANDGPLKTLKLILRKIIRHITFNKISKRLHQKIELGQQLVTT